MTTILEPPTSPTTGRPDDLAAAARETARTHGRTHATAPTRARSRRAKGPHAKATHAARGSRIDPAPWAAGIVTVTVGLWVLAGGLSALLAGGIDSALAISQLSGLLAALAALGGLVLTARPAWLERGAGLDRMISWHRITGMTAAFGMLGHVVASLVCRGRRAHADVGRAGGPRDGDRVVRGRAGRRPAVRGGEPHLVAADPDPDDLRDVAHGPPGRLSRRGAGLPARPVQRHNPGQQRRRALVVDRALRRHDGDHRGEPRRGDRAPRAATAHHDHPDHPRGTWCRLVGHHGPWCRPPRCPARAVRGPADHDPRPVVAGTPLLAVGEPEARRAAADREGPRRRLNADPVRRRRGHGCCSRARTAA